MFRATDKNVGAFGLLLLILLLCPACRHVPATDVPSIKEGPFDSSTFPFNNTESIPVVMVGRILGNELVGPPRQRSVYPFHIQLYRVKVAVVQMLRGTLPRSEMQVYYFAGSGPIGGPPELGMRIWSGTWEIGDLEMFFLRWDGNLLRSTCDFQKACVTPVYSGTHPHFTVRQGEPIRATVVRYLLGEDFSDLPGMVKEIYFSYDVLQFSKTYALQAYKQLLANQYGAIRGAACDALNEWKQPCSFVVRAN